MDRFLLDPGTVFYIQGRCPGLSYEDRASIQTRIVSGEIFPAVRGEKARSEIFRRLCSVKQVIMSTYTFLEDTKYLELGARILKKLFLEKCKGSLRQRFNSVRTGQTKIKVQTGEFTFQDRQLPSVSEAAWVSYRQLWLYALRHFLGLDKTAPLIDSGSESSWQTRSEP